MSPSLQLSETPADTLTPPQIVRALESAINSHAKENLISLFSEGAHVHDGGLRYSGPTGVRGWIQDCFERYALSIKILTISGQDDTWQFDASVSGRFEGSPVLVTHYLRIENGKIISLETIAPSAPGAATKAASESLSTPGSGEIAIDALKNRFRAEPRFQ